MEGAKERDGLWDRKEEGKDLQYVEWEDGTKEKRNVTFMRTTREVMEGNRICAI